MYISLVLIVCFILDIHINKTNSQTLDRYQGRLMKRLLGLSKWCHSTPLLKATGIMPLSMELLKKCVIDDSIANSFYCYLRNIVSAYKSIQGMDGLLDTIRNLLNCGNNELLNIFLKAF